MFVSNQEMEAGKAAAAKYLKQGERVNPYLVRAILKAAAKVREEKRIDRLDRVMGAA